jgi:hypothetical protein
MGDVGIMNYALAERGGAACEAGERIPTGRYPVWSTTKVQSIAIGDTTSEFTFEAERDFLYTDMSVAVELADGTAVRAFVSVSYCNTTYMSNSSTRAWAYCCQRKPVFLVGHRENKTLRITVALQAANAAEVFAEVTLSGFQGNGCCG